MLDTFGSFCSMYSDWLPGTLENFKLKKFADCYPYDKDKNASTKIDAHAQCNNDTDCWGFMQILGLENATLEDGTYYFCYKNRTNAASVFLSSHSYLYYGMYVL